MNVQFSEHADGKKSLDSKVVKLHKLAKLLNITIHIDGIAYGKEVEKNVPEENVGWSTEVYEKPQPEQKADTPKKAKTTKKKG